MSTNFQKIGQTPEELNIGDKVALFGRKQLATRSLWKDRGRTSTRASDAKMCCTRNWQVTFWDTSKKVQVAPSRKIESTHNTLDLSTQFPPPTEFQSRAIGLSVHKRIGHDFTGQC